MPFQPIPLPSPLPAVMMYDKLRVVIYASRVDKWYIAIDINHAMDRLEADLQHYGWGNGISPEILITGHLTTPMQIQADKKNCWTCPLDSMNQF